MDKVLSFLETWALCFCLISACIFWGKFKEQKEINRIHTQQIEALGALWGEGR